MLEILYAWIFGGSGCDDEGMEAAEPMDVVNPVQYHQLLDFQSDPPIEYTKQQNQWYDWKIKIKVQKEMEKVQVYIYQTKKKNR